MSNDQSQQPTTQQPQQPNEQKDSARREFVKKGALAAFSVLLKVALEEVIGGDS